MKSHFLKSYCKINIFLNVGKKNKKEKLHNVQSLIVLINLFDEIKIKKIKEPKDKVEFLGLFSKYINKSNNSIINSLSLLRKEGIIKKNQSYKIQIKKKVPVFSGLAGGSSNSATIIKYFCKSKKVKKSKLNYFSKLLGSDLRIFFYSEQVLQKNLRSFQNLRKKSLFYFVIVYPFLKCSTKEIYSRFRPNSILKKNKKLYLGSELKLINFLKNQTNSLQKVVIRKFPIINKILKDLEVIKDCKFSRMTGSGSACFGVFLTKKSAELGLKKIKKKFPKYWCVTSKTI